jgi:hypothetical protein
LPHQPHPWDIPPFPEKGAETEDITFTAVGRALSGWETFEEALAALFAIFVGARSYAGIRAYGSVLTFRGRSDMIKAAAQTYFLEKPNPPLQAKLRSLQNLADKYSPRRNEIAHGIVRQYFMVTAEHRGTGYVLCPSDYSTNKTALTFLTAGMPVGQPIRFIAPGYAYSSAEIDAFGQRFRELEPVVVPIRAELIRLLLRAESIALKISSAHSSPTSRDVSKTSPMLAPPARSIAGVISISFD